MLAHDVRSALPQNMVLVRPWPQEIELPAEADGTRRCYYYFGVAKKPVRMGLPPWSAAARRACREPSLHSELHELCVLSICYVWNMLHSRLYADITWRGGRPINLALTQPQASQLLMLSEPTCRRQYTTPISGPRRPT